MNDRSYSVVLEPQLQEGFERSKVVKKLAALFKRDDQVIVKLLAASPRIIRKDLDLASAEKYVRLIMAVGASARIQPAETPEPQAEPVSGEMPHLRESNTDSERASAPKIPRPERVPGRPTVPVPEVSESEAEEQPFSAKQYVQTDDDSCPRCGYKAATDDDVLLVRGDCPRCGLLVKKDLGVAVDSGGSDEAAITDYYEGTIPATWERRALASIYTLSMFLGAYAVITLLFLFVFAPLESVHEYIGKRFLSAAFDVFPMFSTALIVIGLCVAVPFFNEGRSWAQVKFEINLLYTPEAQVGGLYLSLLFRFAVTMIISFLPGMVVLWIAQAFGRFSSPWSINVVTVVCAALSWAAASFYATRRQDKRSLLDLAAGTIQIEDSPLSASARMTALLPFAAVVSVWALLGGVVPLILKM